MLGLGGLGHLGALYAVAMGFETVATARGAERADFELQSLNTTRVVLGPAAAAHERDQKTLSGTARFRTVITTGR